MSEVARAVGSALDEMTAIMPGDYTTIRIQRTPDAMAIAFRHHTVSWAALERMSAACVTLYRQLDIEPGQRVAYIGRNSELFFAALFAAMRYGVILVPVNWRLTASEMRAVLEDSDSALAFVDDEFIATAKSAFAGRDVPILPVEGNATSLREQLATLDPATPMARDIDAICLQLYTSGTSGRPKGALFTERAIGIARHSEHMSPDFGGWQRDEIALSAMPNFHIAGMGWVLHCLMRGVPIVITADPSAESILGLCERYGITRSYMVPTILRVVLEMMRARNISLRKLRCIYYGAAVMDPPLLKAAIEEIGCGFLQYYGMTELAGGVTTLGPATHDLARPHLLHSVGTPMPGAEIEIRDPAGNLVPFGTHGEIWSRCMSMMQGYAGLPEATAEALVDGWYRTGDGGYLTPEGFLFLTDRIKDMIVTGGENVYPAEVEKTLRTHPAIGEVAVIGLPDERWGETVVAVVELRPGTDFDAADLIAHARQTLAGFKIPRRVILHDGLPRNTAGKVQRSLLKQSLMKAGVATR